MKATGIVRRIDDLGRVVIPKEIRRTLRIREGDPLEIFVDREGEVILPHRPRHRPGRGHRRGGGAEEGAHGPQGGLRVGEVEAKLAGTAASFLGRQMER